MLLQAYLYIWTMTVFMIQSETLPALLIVSNAGLSSSSCRIWIIRDPTDPILDTASCQINRAGQRIDHI